MIGTVQGLSIVLQILQLCAGSSCSIMIADHFVATPPTVPLVVGIFTLFSFPLICTSLCIQSSGVSLLMSNMPFPIQHAIVLGGEAHEMMPTSTQSSQTDPEFRFSFDRF
jgi:hypothetical protein